MADPLEEGDPRRVGPYRLQGRLGTGGMAQVYLGRSPGGRPVAVKLVTALTGDPELRRRFATEVEAARKVGGFYTAQVVDADPEGDPPWLATAYISGLSLEQAVLDDGPWSVAAVATLGAGLAEGLAVVHAQGLVHRDLKPGNVILAEDGPRLIDFGIARTLDATSYTRTRTVLGTAAYMSPEQATGGGVGPPSDIFSLGCVLAFAATGRSAFGSGTPEAVAYRIVHEEPDLTGVPLRLVRTISSCLEKKPARRPDPDHVVEKLARLAPDAEPHDGHRLPEIVTKTARRVAELVPHQLTAALSSREIPSQQPQPPPEEPATPNPPRQVRAWQAYASLSATLFLALFALIGLGQQASFVSIRTMIDNNDPPARDVWWVVMMLAASCCSAFVSAAQLNRFVRRIGDRVGGTVVGLLSVAAALTGLASPPLAFYGMAHVLGAFAGPLTAWWASFTGVILVLVLAIGWYVEGDAVHPRPRAGNRTGRRTTRPEGPSV